MEYSGLTETLHPTKHKWQDSPVYEVKTTPKIETWTPILIDLYI